MDNHNNAGHSVSMFFTGLVLGSFVAMLFTPRSGEDMRKSIIDGADTMKSGIKDAASSAQQSVGRVANDAKDIARDAASSTQQSVSRAANDAKHVAKDAAKRATSNEQPEAP